MAENELAWEVFLVLSSQLRVAGLGVVTGIDLSSFGVVCDAKNIPQEERSLTLDKIIELNRIAVRYWQEASKSEA